MNERETADLTMALVASGKHHDMSSLGTFVGDSTRPVELGTKQLSLSRRSWLRRGCRLARCRVGALAFRGVRLTNWS